MKTVALLAAAVLIAMSAGVADAASKKKPSTSTSSQKDKIYLQLLENCRKKYGRMQVHHVTVDWKRKRYTCYVS